MQDSNLRMHESKSCALPTWLIPSIYGERTGIRTPDTRLRRALLYPAELCTHIYNGAGEGDRTLTAGLEGRNSTIELHPHILLVEDGGFEPPKASLTDLQSAPFGRSGNPPKISFGAGDRNRTYNLLITSQLLYR